VTDTLDVYEVWPDYFEVQRRGLWYYERLWAVLLRELERRTTGRRLTEFGSGPGFLLKLAERRIWDARGIEPSLVARAHAEAMGCLCLDKPPYLWTDDAIISTEVLEHVIDPLATLKEWSEVLFDGGLLALSVPNDNNPLQRLFGRLLAPRGNERGGLLQCGDRSRPWVHPTHLHYFNPKSLKALVESAGFEVVWQRTSFPVELLMVLPIPRRWAWKLSRLWPAPPFLWRFHVGRHCLLVARKIDQI